jgi:predicted nucleic acid-binding protein
MKNILIDTNIYSHAFGGTPKVVSVLQKMRKIAISSVSIGELLAGFEGGSKGRQNREKLKEFLDSPRVEVYAIDENTAEFYAEILNKLKKKGKPIPTNDIWIAAVALQYGLRLFTKDRHSKDISGLNFTLSSYFKTVKLYIKKSLKAG